MITIVFSLLFLFYGYVWRVIIMILIIYIVDLGVNIYIEPSILITCLLVVIFAVTALMGPEISNLGNILIKSSLVFRLILFNTYRIFLFFVIFELTVVFISILIIVEGKSYRKIRSMFYLIFYTVGFSLMFLVGILLIFKELGSISILISNLESVKSYFVSILVTLVILVKIPLILVHVWLPKAHVDSPIAGSIVLAGVILRMGAYGLIIILNQIDFLGFCFTDLLWWWSFLSGFFMVYFCFVEVDLKKIVAYSSVAHMSLICLAVLTLGTLGMKSSILIMISHGIISPIIFWSLGKIYRKRKTRNMNSLWGGGISVLIGSWIIFLSLLFNMGLPPLVRFWGEFVFLSRIIGKSELIFIFLIKIAILYGSFNIYNNTKVNFKRMTNMIFLSKNDSIIDMIQFSLILGFMLLVTMKIWLF